MPEPATKSKPAQTGGSTPVMARSRLPAWILAVLLVVTTIALYWPATHHDFVDYDDNLYVTSNVHVQSGLTLESVKWAFLNPVAFNWHPMTVLSHMLDCQIFGSKPWGHHLTSLLLHALNAALVFVLLRQMTGAMWRSLFVAALFAVHPLRVESVAWVAERKDVLSGFFGFLSLVFYVHFVESMRKKLNGDGSTPLVRGPQAFSHIPSPIFYLLSLSCFILGLMSKPMLVTWPFVMLLLDYWPLQRFKAQGSGFRVQKLVYEKIPFFVLAALASALTFMVQKLGGTVANIESMTLGARIGNALISYCRYLEKMVWPTDLAYFYPRPDHWPLEKVLLAGVFLVSVSFFLYVHRRRCPYLLVGWLWFLGTLVPVVGLVQVGNQAMADRYTYLPSLGLLILTIWGACELARRWRHGAIILSAVGSAAIVVSMGLTRLQLGYWQDSETLFRHALAVTENNYFAHAALGNLLLIKGQINDAISEYKEVTRIIPDDPYAYNSLGATFLKKGEMDEAIRQFQEAVRLKPDFAEARFDLGTVLSSKGQTDEAINQFREAIVLQPDDAKARYNLGTVLFFGKGQTDEAINQFREAIRLKSDYSEAYNNLGITLLNKGQSDEAIIQFQEVIRLKPDNVGAHNNLGIAYTEKGEIDEAILQFQEAIRLKPDDVEARGNLARALGKKTPPVNP